MGSLLIWRREGDTFDTTQQMELQLIQNHKVSQLEDNAISEKRYKEVRYEDFKDK